MGGFVHGAHFMDHSSSIAVGLDVQAHAAHPNSE